MNEIGALEREARERQFVVRAVLSDHVPLAGPMAEILTRPSYHLMSVNDNLLTIFLHHGGMNAAFFDLVGSGPDGALAYIGVEVESRFPSNCFWAARTAVSQLLDTRRTRAIATPAPLHQHLACPRSSVAAPA